MVTQNEILRGSKILVAEDEFLIAQNIADGMSAAGATVIGPTRTVQGALELIEGKRPDAAVIDVSLADGPAKSIITRLRDLAVPFVIVTGYSSTALPSDLAIAPYCEKPFDLTALVIQVASLISSTFS